MMIIRIKMTASTRVALVIKKALNELPLAGFSSVLTAGTVVLGSGSFTGSASLVLDSGPGFGDVAAGSVSGGVAAGFDFGSG